jgi:DNA-binding IclR family transcriptional regulator
MKHARNLNAAGIADSVSAGLDGTQTIRRSVVMLKIIASHRWPGVTLSSIAKVMQLSRSTTHRILKCLLAEQLIERRADGHFYTIGRLAYELSLSVVRDFHGSLQWNSLVNNVVRRTNHTTQLLARSGIEAVCIQKAEGRSTLWVTPVDVGQRRPLGVGAGALALLSGFEPAEIERIVRTISPTLHQFPNLSADLLVKDALEARERGYSISRGRVYPEVVGVGLLLPSASESQLAISIAAPASMVDNDGLARLAESIKSEVAALAEQPRKPSQ